MRFDIKENLSPCHIGPYWILRRFSSVAYEMDFPSDLASIHPVFHASLLKKCIGNSTSTVPLESISVEESFSYEEVPVEIF